MKQEDVIAELAEMRNRQTILDHGKAPAWNHDENRGKTIAEHPTLRDWTLIHYLAAQQ